MLLFMGDFILGMLQLIVEEFCPTGYHIPSQTEWKTLETFLGGQGLSGGKLKEMGTLHWLRSKYRSNK